MTMLISEKMNARLNEQIGHELGASYSYLAMSCRFNELGLRVFAKRFQEQATEEHQHAMKFVKFIQDVGGTVVIPAITAPRGDYPDAMEMVRTALEQELRVTRQINEIAGLSDDERDYATRSFIQWFVDEQVEEVSSMQELLDLLKLAGPDKLLQVEARLRHMMTEGN